jgi:hypothetical protein
MAAFKARWVEKLGHAIPYCRAKAVFRTVVVHGDGHGFPTTTAFETLQFRMPCNCRQTPNKAHRLTTFGTSREGFEHGPK